MRRVLAAMAVLLLGLTPVPMQACAVCFGQSDDAMAHGMNMGIFALLLVVLFVLSGIAAFGIFLMRRAARFPSEPFPVADTVVQPASVPDQPDMSDVASSPAVAPFLEPISQPSK
jgi:hypothetical protein